MSVWNQTRRQGLAPRDALPTGPVCFGFVLFNHTPQRTTLLCRNKRTYSCGPRQEWMVCACRANCAFASPEAQSSRLRGRFLFFVRVQRTHMGVKFSSRQQQKTFFERLSEGLRQTFSVITLSFERSIEAGVPRAKDPPERLRTSSHCNTLIYSPLESYAAIFLFPVRS